MSGTGWNCPECTYLNLPFSNLCELCIAPKPSQVAWSCVACTYSNPGSAGSCSLCLTPRLPSFPATTTTTSQTPRARAPSAPSDDLWSCNSCGWFHNAPAAKSCEVCGSAKRSGPISRPHSSVHEYEKWACPSCTLTNPISAEKCELCQVAKPVGPVLLTAQALAREADELNTALAVLVAAEKKAISGIALQPVPKKDTSQEPEKEEDDEEEWDEEDEDDDEPWEVDDAIAHSLREGLEHEKKVQQQQQQQETSTTTTPTSTTTTTAPVTPLSPTGTGASEREKLAKAAEERLKQTSTKPSTTASTTTTTTPASVPTASVPAARQSLLRRMSKRVKLAGAFDHRVTTPRAGGGDVSTTTTPSQSQPRKSVKKRASQRVKLAQAVDKRLGTSTDVTTTTTPTSTTTTTSTTSTLTEPPLVVGSSAGGDGKGKDGNELLKTDPDQEQPPTVEKKESKEKIQASKDEIQEKKKLSVEVKQTPEPRKSLRRPVGADTFKSRQSVVFQLSEWKQANSLIEQGTGKKEETKEVKEDSKTDGDSKSSGDAKIIEDLTQLLEGDKNRMQALEKHNANFRGGRVQASVYYYFLVKTFGASILPKALPLVLLWLTPSPNRKEALRCMHVYAMANKCPRCMQSVYHQEGIRAADRSWHRWCFKCCYDPTSPLSPLSPTTPRATPTTPRSPSHSTPSLPPPVPTTTVCTTSLTVNNYISARGLIYCQKHAPK